MENQIKDPDNTQNQSTVNSEKKRMRWQLFHMFLIGIGIGWLVGLSISPVVATVLTSILGIAAGLVAGLQVVSRSDVNALSGVKKQFLDARPASLLIIGIALAATGGMISRTYHIFDPVTPSGWYADTEKKGKDSESGRVATKQDVAGLYSAFSTRCDLLLGLYNQGNQEAFIGELQKATDIFGIKEMLDEFEDDPEALALFLKIICQNYQPLN